MGRPLDIFQPWLKHEFLVSVGSNLPRLTEDLAGFYVQDEIPTEYVISVMTSENALQQIKVNKAVGPDNVSAWVLRDNASTTVHLQRP